MWLGHYLSVYTCKLGKLYKLWGLTACEAQDTVSTALKQQLIYIISGSNWSNCIVLNKENRT